MTHTVFVYGTLKRGCPLHGWVEDQKYVGVGELAGHTLLSFGAYPALLAVPEGSCSVLGEIYTLDDKRFQRLKQMEEAVGYTTETVKVKRGLSQHIDCLTFLYSTIGDKAVEWRQPPPPKGRRGSASTYPGHVAIV